MLNISSFVALLSVVISSSLALFVVWRLKSQGSEIQKAISGAQLQGFQTIQESLLLQIKDNRDQVQSSLSQHAELLTQHVRQLTEETQRQLNNMNGLVEKRLADGFEKTNTTFTDVVQRLALIDQAQKKITELSTNVMSLQDILADRKARGAFGEVQLAALIRNMIPENHFSLQHTLSNGKRPDCFLFLPQPTGNIAIDAKFPLETYHRMMDSNIQEAELKKAQTQFRIDIRHHIDEIASKYILPGETSDGAMMFIPAESVFAEIHANFADIVDYAQRLRVWMVSPSTMMAILTTARAVLKDAATRQQIHIIQEHLIVLSKDFERFDKRMGQLARHIEQAHEDVSDVQISAKKISQRFTKIEQMEVETISEELESA